MHEGGLAQCSRFAVAHPGVQPFAFAFLVLVYIWLVAPSVSTLPRVLCFAVLAAVPVSSNLLHGDRAGALGFRTDNLARSAREVGLVTAVGAALLLVLGACTRSTFGPRTDFVRSLVAYPPWGFLQQFALQGFVLRRSIEAWRRPRAAAAVAACLFGALHYPNPVLVPFTALAGYVWCRLFERTPNLFTLAVSHGWLAAVLMAALPPAWLHNLRVGPGFWTAW